MDVFSNNQLTLNFSVISVGAFDGMHRGHQTLIKKAAMRAQALNIPSVVYTFNPPPRAHFQKQMILTSIEEKLDYIKKLDIDYVIVADFNDQYASRPASSFIEELISLGPKEIWVGQNFQFGKGKKGDVSMLSQYFKTFIHPFITCDKGETISSTRIRKLIHNRDWLQANRLLGRNQFEMI